MSADNQVFLAWEECIISQEKGNRVVHYYLKHFSGDSVLAVVGTERSIRHMIYVVSDDLLNAYGYMRIVNAGTKWRARREVVEWLTKVVSKYRQSSDISNSQTTGSTESLKSSEVSIAGISAHLAEKMASRKLKVQSSDIVWSGDAWICCRELMHYPAFCRDEVTISVYSFVYIMGEEEMSYLAYLEDLYEDKKGQKKVKVRWFHHNQELKDLIPQLNAHPREVFITPHVQVISAECIDGVALVFTPKDYDKYLALHPHSSSSGIHMCHREFRNNKVKLFSLSKLRGYSTQAVLSDYMHKMTAHKTNEEVEDCSNEDLARQGAKRTRSFRGNQKMGSGPSGVTNSVRGNQITNCGPTHQRLKIKLSSKGAVGIELVEPEPQCQSSINVGNNIELLCQDSGMCGCWFRCKILQASEKRLKVRYYDVEDVEGPGKLEEWVPASRVAAPDKLGMRHAGRLTVRPWPPVDSLDYAVEIGASVDAWWCDGWWEGVITGIDISGNDSFQVYFPGENRVLTFQKNSMRISRDWVDDKWVEIKSNPNIASLISSTVGAESKPSMCSSSAVASGSALGGSKVITSPSFAKTQDAKQEVLVSASSVDLQSMEGLNLGKQLSIKDYGDKANRGSYKSKKKGSGGKIN